MNLGLRASKRERQVFVGEEEEDETSQDPKGEQDQMGSFQQGYRQSCELGKPQTVQGLRPKHCHLYTQKDNDQDGELREAAVLEGTETKDTSQLEAITDSGWEDDQVHSSGPHNPQAPSGPRWVAWQSSQAVSFVDFAKGRKLLTVISFYNTHQVLRDFGVEVGILEIRIWGRQVWKVD